MKKWIIRCPFYRNGICLIRQAPRDCNGRYNLLKVFFNSRGECGETKKDQLPHLEITTEGEQITKDEFEKQQLARYNEIIDTSLRIIKESKVLNTRLGRCNVILDVCNKILEIRPNNTFAIDTKNKINIIKKVLPIEDAEIKADKYEFKQQWKKAFDSYQDALYHIERNHITQEDFNKAGLETTATKEPLTIQYIKDKITSLKEKLEKKK